MTRSFDHEASDQGKKVSWEDNSGQLNIGRVTKLIEMVIFHSILISIIVIKVVKKVITYQRTTLIINQGHEQGQEEGKLAAR